MVGSPSACQLGKGTLRCSVIFERGSPILFPARIPQIATITNSFVSLLHVSRHCPPCGTSFLIRTLDFAFSGLCLYQGHCWLSGSVCFCVIYSSPDARMLRLLVAELWGGVLMGSVSALRILPLFIHLKQRLPCSTILRMSDNVPHV